MTSDPLIGRKIGDYEVVEKIGRGGMGEVYKAYDPALDRYVAIKLLSQSFKTDPLLIQRFKREAQAAARLRHPNIVQVHKFGTTEDSGYMVMEYVAGTNLRDEMDRRRKAGQKFTPEEIIHILGQIADALDYAHTQFKVIHRDVKPGNILLTPEGQPILGDFGLAMFREPERSSQLTGGHSFGTPEYIAPEQAIDSRNAVPQSDIYSLGGILYEIITQHLPFNAESSISLALKHISEDPTPPRQYVPDLPPAVEAVILRALAKEPEQRFESGHAMIQALREAWLGKAAKATAGAEVISPAIAASSPTVPPPPEAKPTQQARAEAQSEARLRKAAQSSEASRAQAKAEQLSSAASAPAASAPATSASATGGRVSALGDRDHVPPPPPRAAALTPAPAQPAPPPARPSRWPALAGALFVIVLGGLLGFMAINQGWLAGFTPVAAATPSQTVRPTQVEASPTRPANTPIIVRITATASSVQASPTSPASSTPQTPSPSPTSRPTDTPTRTPSPTTTSTPSPSPTPTLAAGQVLTRSVDAMAMRFVPGSAFLMGNDAANAPGREKPQHEVTLNSYWIDQTEVTNGQYRLCVEAGVCSPPVVRTAYDNSNRANHPVAYINWSEAQAYCQWLAEKTGWNISLPTEAQWEKAASWDADAQSKRRYPWGDTEPGAALLNFDRSGLNRTTSVGSYPASASFYGAMDMAGNVWEWTADRYNAAYYQTEPPAWVNPVGPPEGKERAVRGGSFGYSRDYATTTYRNPVPEGARGADLGFRCAVPAEQLTP